MDTRTTASHAAALRFERVELRPTERRLLVDGQPAPLGARAFDLLLALAERPGQLLTKHALIDLVWPGLVVEENNLQVQVSALRKVLGPQAVATIPGRGYRFTLPAANDAPHPAAAAPPVAPAPTQLPAAEPLIGREAELAAVHTLLREHAVVSIVGAGGIGKTRLAHAAMAEADTLYADKRWWVDLAALNEASLVPATVAAGLGVALPAERPPLDALASALAARSGLLVLDNCEHLADSVAGLVDTLRAQAPGLRLLVTSQESLKCRDEQVFRLGPLALPAPDHTDGAAGYGAVNLFVARAQALVPSFRLSADNDSAVVEVCRRLDGIPLAIELAAARVPMLGVQGVRARLDHMFSLLTGVSRATLRRHQTLLAALRWSHDLLADDERALLRRLGVFNGGFTLELAQQVARDEQLDEWRVLDLLGQLIDKSLVIVEGDDNAPRYRMLEPTRAFALEQLAVAGESAEWLERHAHAVLASATRVEQGRWTQPTTERWRGARELGNLRAAIDWALSAAGDRPLAYALLGRGWTVFQVGGAADEALRRMRALWPPPAGLAAEVEAAFCLALLRCRGDDARDEFMAMAHRAVSLYGELGDTEHLADAVLCLAALNIARGKDPRTPALIAQVQGLLTPASPWRQQAYLAMVEGIWALRGHDFAAATAAYQRQADCYRRDGSAFGIYMAQSNLCGVLLDAGEIEAAIDTATQVIGGLQRMKAPYGVGEPRAHLALALAVRGHPGDDVLGRAREAFDLLRAGGGTYRPLMAAALHHARSGDAARAALVAGHAIKVQAQAKSQLCPIDAQVEQQLRALVAAAGAAEASQAWLRAGETLGEAEAVGLAFEGAPLAGYIGPAA